MVPEEPGSNSRLGALAFRDFLSLVPLLSNGQGFGHMTSESSIIL